MQSRWCSFVLAGTLLVCSACGSSNADPFNSLSSPTGLAVAGSGFDRLFIANSDEDTLHVFGLDNPDPRREVGFIPSDTVFFPLRIPVGTTPRDLARSQNGRYVVVLNWALGSLTLVDADELRIVGDPAQPVPVGPLGARAAALATQSAVCDAPCLGRFYVSLPDEGTIVELELVEFVDAPMTASEVLRPSRVFAVGGKPTSISLSPDGSYAAVADSESDAVVLLSLESGATQVGDVGNTPGPVAISTDGRTLAVARPALRDVVFFDGVDAGQLIPVDANSEVGPSPRCLRQCSEPGSVCESAHPADRAVCVTDTGISQGTETYMGAWIGIVPTVMNAWGVGAGLPALEYSCDSELFESDPDDLDILTVVQDETIVVAGLNGELRFIALDRDEFGTLSPRASSLGSCRTPVVEFLNDESFSTDLRSQIESLGEVTTLEELLAPCPDTPADRSRFACANEAGTVAADPAGVSLLAGLGASPDGGFASFGRDIGFRWEGELLSAARERGGEIDTEGFFYDASFNLAELDVRIADSAAPEPFAGDVLQILSPALQLEECDQALADLGGGDRDTLCTYERRIVGIDGGGPLGEARFILDAPLPQACFRASGAIAYTVRAGDQFIVDVGFDLRLSPGDLVGPGGNVGRNLGLSFRVADFDTQSGLSACERYPDLAGLPGAGSGLSPVLYRGEGREALIVRVRDPFTIIRGGRERDSSTGSFVAGTVPTSMTTSSGLATPPRLWVSYSGSDTVFGFFPRFDLNGLLTFPEGADTPTGQVFIR